MAKKEVFKSRSFKDLTKYKKRYPIYFDDEIVCSLEELTSDKMSQFLALLFEDFDKAEDKNGEMILGLSEKNICFLLREMIRDIDDIQTLSDKELIFTIKEMGSDIQQEFVKGIKFLVMNKVEELLRSVTNELIQSGEKPNEEESSQ